MANPQVEQGHVRIANELYDEILRRTFSKRQQNLVLFIWRLSYGTGQKDCEIKQFNLFELSGIYKSDIKKELNYLRECAVLEWDENTMIFSINKNYKLWQISPNKNWDSDKFKDLIHHNLSRKKVSKTLTIDNEEVSKTLTDEPIKVSKILTIYSKKVGKTLTMELVKHQLRHRFNLDRARSTGALYPLLYPLKIKDINNYNNNAEVDSENDTKKPNAFTYYMKNFEQHIPPAIIDKMNDWLDDFSDEVLIHAMEKSLAQGLDKSNWAYVNRILVNWHKKGLKTIDDIQKDDEKFYAKQQARFGNNNFNQKPEIKPDWFEKRKQQPQQPQQKKVDEQAQAEMEALLSKYKAK